jgi:hypothetical protein
MSVRGLDDCLSHMRQVLLSKFGDAVAVEKIAVQDNFMEQENGAKLKQMWLRINGNTLRPGQWRHELVNEAKKEKSDEPNKHSRLSLMLVSLIYIRETSPGKASIILVSMGIISVRR